LLDVLGVTVNLFNHKAILDLSQSISRVGLRVDGTTPTLTSTCGRLYVPSRGVMLTPQNCLALQGIRVTEADISDFSPCELYKMAGNAMSVPVVGSVMWAAVCELKERV
jgi:site-specific DNA-cytosine methylase